MSFDPEREAQRPAILKVHETDIGVHATIVNTTEIQSTHLTTNHKTMHVAQHESSRARVPVSAPREGTAPALGERNTRKLLTMSPSSYGSVTKSLGNYSQNPRTLAHQNKSLSFECHRSCVLSVPTSPLPDP
jgi:hypothetical protein